MLATLTVTGADVVVLPAASRALRGERVRAVADRPGVPAEPVGRARVLRAGGRAVDEEPDARDADVVARVGGHLDDVAHRGVRCGAVIETDGGCRVRRGAGVGPEGDHVHDPGRSRSGWRSRCRRRSLVTSLSSVRLPKSVRRVVKPVPAGGHRVGRGSGAEDQIVRVGGRRRAAVHGAARAGRRRGDVQRVGGVDARVLVDVDDPEGVDRGAERRPHRVRAAGDVLGVEDLRAPGVVVPPRRRRRAGVVVALRVGDRRGGGVAPDRVDDDQIARRVGEENARLFGGARPDLLARLWTWLGVAASASSQVAVTAKRAAAARRGAMNA